MSNVKTFGIGDVSKIIELLRNNIYKNPIQTLVQEYISNARDAHRECGNRDEAINVTYPEYDNNYQFRVRDYANGLSDERIENVFIKYGATTKKGDDNQTGGFGIGAKSAWAYTDKFTVATFIDGTRKEYLASISDDNDGQLELVSTKITDEPNGTEVSLKINSSDETAFRKAIIRATYFWSYRPEYGNVTYSKELSSASKDQKYISKFTKNVLLFDEGSNVTSYDIPTRCIVVDGIPYPVEDDLLRNNDHVESLFDNIITKSYWESSKVLFVDANNLEISASRESISLSKNNVEFLSILCLEEVDNIKQTVEADFASVNSIEDFATMHHKYRKWKAYKTEAYLGLYECKGNSENDIVGEGIENIWLKKITISDADRVHKETVGKIPCSEINMIYVNDGDESTIKVNQKLRLLLTNYGYEHVYLATRKHPNTNGYGEEIHALLYENAWKGLEENLSAHSILALPVPPKVVRTYKSIGKKKEKYVVTLHGVIGTTYAWNTGDRLKLKGRDVIAEDQEGDFVYFDYRCERETRSKVAKLYNFLRRYRVDNINFCAVGSKGVKTIEKLSNFVKFDDYLANFEYPKEHTAAVMASMIGEASSKLTFLNEILGRSYKLADPQFERFGLIKAMVYDRLKGVEHEAKTPDFLPEVSKIHITAGREFRDRIVKEVNAFKLKYPLLETILDGFHRLDEDAQQDAIEYIENKHEKSLSANVNVFGETTEAK